MFSRRFETRKCAGGVKIKLYKDPSKAFPPQVNALSTQANATLRGLEGLEIDVAVGVAKEIAALRFQISRTNENYQSDLHAVYYAYSMDPCSDPGYFRRKLDEILLARRSYERALLQSETVVHLVQAGAPAGEIRDAVTSALSSLQGDGIQTVVQQQHAAVTEVNRWSL